MDFKSRFQVKKSFINKRGDFVDPRSNEVTTIHKPLQVQKVNLVNSQGPG